MFAWVCPGDLQTDNLAVYSISWYASNYEGVVLPQIQMAPHSLFAKVENRECPACYSHLRLAVSDMHMYALVGIVLLV